MKVCSLFTNPHELSKSLQYKWLLFMIEVLIMPIILLCTVLHDEVQRAIYDNYGLKNLEEMKHGDQWAVVQRTMTPQEIREEYERLAR